MKRAARSVTRLCLALVLALPACNHEGAAPQLVPARASARAAGYASRYVAHVIILIQENRTPDNLFHCFSPKADVCPAYGRTSHGRRVRLQQKPLEWGGDISHSHATFVKEYADGNMDGFNLARTTLSACNDSGTCPYSYAPQEEVQPYWDMANQYAFADRMFQGNQGPSGPAHQELVSATASIDGDPGGRQIAENSGETVQGSPHFGCDAPRAIRVLTIPLMPIGAHEGDPVFPCFERPSLAGAADAAGITWRYYQHGGGEGLWHAFDAVKSVRYGPDYRYVVTKFDALLGDIGGGRLAQITWAAPDAAHSDHTGNVRDTGGPSWVAAVVNAVGRSGYWSNTVIVVVWDDWGGWYDHVPPPIQNNYELGMRVPLLVISAYAKRGYVSHVDHGFGSILHMTERIFGLPNLGGSDARSDDLGDCFDYNQHARSFVPIKAPPFVPDATAAANQEDP